MKLHRSKTFLISAAGTLVIASSLLGTKVFADNDDFTAPKQLSADEVKALESKVQVINNEFGAFERVFGQIDLPENETAYGEDKVTSETKQIVTDYGVFLKQ